MNILAYKPRIITMDDHDEYVSTHIQWYKIK